MSNVKYGADCCGDRYDVDAYNKCKCGCELYYCRSCYDAHMFAIADILLKQFSATKLRTLLKKEIREQREGYEDIKFKHKV